MLLTLAQRENAASCSRMGQETVAGFLPRPTVPQKLSPTTQTTSDNTMRVFFLFTIVLLITAVKVVAQDKSEVCVEHRNAPPVNAYYWPPDTYVRVYFARGMFTEEQRLTLLTAMKTWTDANEQTGAGINFSYAGEIDNLATCNGCLTVTRREVHKNDRRHYAFFNPLRQSSDGMLISAWIDFDFATTNPKALRGYMVHELGHSLGLFDCKSCQKKKTIMNGFPGINDDNGLLAPSLCDLEVVRQVYDLQRRVNRNIVAEKR